MALKYIATPDDIEVGEVFICIDPSDNDHYVVGDLIRIIGFGGSGDIETVRLGCIGGGGNPFDPEINPIFYERCFLYDRMGEYIGRKMKFIPLKNLTEKEIFILMTTGDCGQVHPDLKRWMYDF